MADQRLIFSTVHGSHLYGLAHAASDSDSYLVYQVDEEWDPQPWVTFKGLQLRLRDNRKRRALQIMPELTADDVTLVELNQFLEAVASGQPMALEALWSTQGTFYDPRFSSLFASLRPSLTSARMLHRRMARTYIFGDKAAHDATEVTGTFKSRRHALRLARNLRLLTEAGHFDPTLSSAEKDQLSSLALLEGDDYLEAFNHAWNKAQAPHLA